MDKGGRLKICSCRSSGVRIPPPLFASVLKWTNKGDLRSPLAGVRRFESCPTHPKKRGKKMDSFIEHTYDVMLCMLKLIKTFGLYLTAVIGTFSIIGLCIVLGFSVLGAFITFIDVIMAGLWISAVLLVLWMIVAVF